MDSFIIDMMKKSEEYMDSLDELTNLKLFYMNHRDKVKYLYHGGQIKILNPTIRMDTRFMDFGKGFYLTENIVTAESLVEAKYKDGQVSTYLFVSEGLKSKQFLSADEDWAEFVKSCRLGYQPKLDYVEGPIADDTIFLAVNEYVSGAMSLKVFLESIKFKKPTHQICLLTDKALQRLEVL